MSLGSDVYMGSLSHEHAWLRALDNHGILQGAHRRSVHDRAIVLARRLGYKRAVKPRLRPLSLAEWMRLITTAARLPARKLPANSHFCRPSATGGCGSPQQLTREERQLRRRAVSG